MSALMNPAMIVMAALLAGLFLRLILTLASRRRRAMARRWRRIDAILAVPDRARPTRLTSVAL